MSGQVSRHWSVALVATWAFGSMPERSAAQEKKNDPTPTEALDPIAGAKKDFETIKAARDAALQPRTDLPRVSMPEWPAAPSGPAVSPLIPAPAKNPGRDAKQGTGNWLVDAMQPPASSRESPRSPGERGRDRERSRNSDAAGGASFGRRDQDGNSPGEKEEPADSRRSGAASDEKDRKDPNAPAVVNPLTRYLGEWMTPQDYALLKPGLAQSTGPADKSDAGLIGSGTSSLGLAGLGAFSGTGAGGDSIFGLPGSTAAGLMPTVPRENPFLQGLALPDASSLAAGGKARPVPINPVPASIALPSMIPTSRQETVPPAKIPDFVPPANDEKYFKQLKRF